MFEIIPFDSNTHIPAAAELFTAAFRRLRAAVPAIPDRLADPECVSGSLRWLMNQCAGVAAVENGRMIGYLGWMLAPHFRETDRLGAYVPEWGHAVLPEEGGPNKGGAVGTPAIIGSPPAPRTAAIYRALYRAAAVHWLAAGVQVHAITLLADDANALNAWFWSGFGLTVVDAVRPMDISIRAKGLEVPAGVEIRPAGPADAEILAEIEAEHWRHYAEPPTLMVPQSPDDSAAFTRLMAEPPNMVWLAFKDGQPAGYLRFVSWVDRAAASLSAQSVVGCDGAYVRPRYRGLGLAPILLEAARRDYLERGFTSLAVDYESLNPEAAAFWTRYFTPVVYSLLRVPERVN